MDNNHRAGGDNSLFALLYGNREDIDRLADRLTANESAMMELRIQLAKDIGKLEQVDSHLQSGLESLLDRLRAVEQANTSTVSKYEASQGRMSKLDRELHGQMVRLQTIGTAIGAFLTIAQIIQFLSSNSIN